MTLSLRTPDVALELLGKYYNLKALFESDRQHFGAGQLKQRLQHDTYTDQEKEPFANNPHKENLLESVAAAAYRWRHADMADWHMDPDNENRYDPSDNDDKAFYSASFGSACNMRITYHKKDTFFESEEEEQGIMDLEAESAGERGSLDADVVAEDEMARLVFLGYQRRLVGLYMEKRAEQMKKKAQGKGKKGKDNKRKA